MLEALTQRWLIVALAVAGAALVSLAPLIAGRVAPGKQEGVRAALTRIGYGATIVSVALFIVAGFISGR